MYRSCSSYCKEALGAGVGIQQVLDAAAISHASGRWTGIVGVGDWQAAGSVL